MDDRIAGPAVIERVPQSLRGLIDRLRRTPAHHADWEGIYTNKHDVIEQGRGFDSDFWLDLTREQTRRAADASTPIELRSDVQLLATLVSRCESRPIRVLDFGGGMGIGYLRLVRALGVRSPIAYTVVDGERICTSGRALLGDRTELEFRTTLPEGARFDIVVACSSLQYIEDWRALLEGFAAMHARHILLADVPAGEVPSFWTAQLTVRGSRIAYHFLDVREIVSTMEGCGYTLAVRGTAERPLGVQNLPEGRRVERPCNLLFEVR